MLIVAVHSSSELYGSDRSFLAICLAGVRAGHRVIALLPEEGPLADRLRPQGVDVRVTDVAVLRRTAIGTVAGWRGLWRGLLRSVSVARKLRRPPAGQQTVIVSNTSAVMSGRLIAALSKTPHVQIVREIYTSSLERKLFEMLVKRSAAVICVSEAVRDQFKSAEAWGTRVEVVYSGAELAHSDLTAREEHDGPLRVVCVGRLSSWKGQSTLIRAAARLAEGGIATHVKLVGGEYGGSTTVTRELAGLASDLGMSESVEFVGEVDDPSDYYQWADVVVVPSERPEPFGKVVIEAMNTSRPVVASDQGGPAEVIRGSGAGRLFAPGDSESLARELAKIEPGTAEWQAMSHAAFQRSQTYSVHTNANTVLSIVQAAETGGR
ncbi:glycosyltransferase family 4 protein [Microbacterium arborescens]|uniref:glycosyltransferase family 4 protein n=1 Tax=Microbacterium arborescens TaxID=33883 RepID=UPI003C749A53